MYITKWPCICDLYDNINPSIQWHLPEIIYSLNLCWKLIFQPLQTVKRFSLPTWTSPCYHLSHLVCIQSTITISTKLIDFDLVGPSRSFIIGWYLGVVCVDPIFPLLFGCPVMCSQHLVGHINQHLATPKHQVSANFYKTNTTVDIAPITKWFILHINTRDNY